MAALLGHTVVVATFVVLFVVTRAEDPLQMPCDASHPLIGTNLTVSVSWSIVIESGCTLDFSESTLDASLTFTGGINVSNVDLTFSNIMFTSRGSINFLGNGLPYADHSSLVLRDVSLPPIGFGVFNFTTLFANSTNCTVSIEHVNGTLSDSMGSVCIGARLCTLVLRNVSMGYVLVSSLSSSTASSALFLDVVFLKDAVPSLGMYSAGASFTFINISLPVRGGKPVKNLCSTSSDCTIVLTGVSQPNTAIDDTHCFQIACGAAIRCVITGTDIGPVFSFFENSLRGSVSSVLRLNDIRDVSQSFTEIMHASTNSLVEVANARNLSHCLAMSCMFAVTGCTVGLRNASVVTNRTLDLFGFLSVRSTLTLDHISSAVDSFGLISASAAYARLQATHLDDIYQSFNSSRAYMNEFSCKPLLATLLSGILDCDTLFGMPAVHNVVLIQNVTNASHVFDALGNHSANASIVMMDLQLQSNISRLVQSTGRVSCGTLKSLLGVLLELGMIPSNWPNIYDVTCDYDVPTALTIARVRTILSTPPTTFLLSEDTGRDSVGLTVKLTDVCVENRVLSQVSAVNTTQLSIEYTANWACPWRDGTLNLTLSPSVNLTLVLNSAVISLGFTSAFSVVVSAPASLQTLPLTLTAKGLQVFTLSTEVGLRVGSLDVSSCNLTLGNLQFLLASAVPNATYVSVADNPALSNAKLTAAQIGAGSSSRVVVLSTASSPPTGLQLLYTCGDAVGATLITASQGRYRYGNWSGWTPSMRGFGGWHGLDPATGQRQGPCSCVRGTTWSLTNDATSGCRATSSSSLTANRSQTPSVTLTSTRLRTAVNAQDNCPLDPLPNLQLAPALLNVQDLTQPPSATFNLTLNATAVSWSGAVASMITLAADSDSGSVGLGPFIAQLVSNGFGATRHGTTLTVRLGCAPGLRLPGPDTATLLVLFSDGAMNCSGVGAFGIRVAISPHVDAPLAAAQSTALASGAAGVAAASVGVAALGDVQAMAALGMVQCGSPSGQAVSRKAAFVLGPLQLGDGAEGKLWGLLLLFAAVATLQCACVLLVYVVKRREQPSKGAPPRSVGQVDPLTAAMVLLRFPGLLFSVASAAQQGMAVYAVSSVLTGQLSVASLLGFAFVVALPACVLYGARRWAAATFDVEAGSMVFYKYEHTLAPLGAPTSRRASVLRRVCGALAPVGVWRPTSVVRRVGQPYRLYRPVWASMAVSPSLQALLIGLIAGLPVSHNDSGLCGLQFFGIGVVAMMTAVCGVVARPYASSAMTWIQLGSSSSLMLAVIGNMGMLHQQSVGEAPGGYLVVAQIAAILQIITVVFRCAFSAALKLAETLWWRHDGKRVAWVEGMEPHVAERLDRNGLDACLAVEMTSVDVPLALVETALDNRTVAKSVLRSIVATGQGAR